jgi:hypothetical protein
MGRMTLGIDNTITFKEDTHQYFDNLGDEYQSVTRILKKIQVPFDKEKISGIMATSIAREQGISHEEAKKGLLAEWDQKRDSSINRGNNIDEGITSYLNTGNKVLELAGVINFINTIVKPAYRYYPQIILYDKLTRIAGMTDLVVQRQKTENSIYDFYDYKTNESRGIQFDSIGRKTDTIRHYNRMFLSPLDYLEDCNYNLYTLQLSLYAYLAQTTYGIKVGRLAIIFVDNDMKVTLFPVNYMKLEVMMLTTRMINLNRLPQKVSVIRSNGPAVMSIKDEDDW